MKSKKKAKTRSKSKPHTKSKSHSKSKTHARTGTKTTHPTMIESIPSPNVTLNPAVKTCQEVEIGDIGGFRSPDDLEEHEKRCSEPATKSCTHFGTDHCLNHYNP